MIDNTVTVVGNLTTDPELRFTSSGVAVANFTVASTTRYLKNGVWTDGDTLFMTCVAWRQFAENVTESLTKGDRVIVTGRLRQRSYETSNGDKRTVIELDVEEIGASLRYATAKVIRATRDGAATTASEREQTPF